MLRRKRLKDWQVKISMKTTMKLLVFYCLIVLWLNLLNYMKKHQDKKKHHDVAIEGIQELMRRLDLL